MSKKYGARAFDSGPTELTDQQWQAINLLIAGHKQVDIADQVGCDPSTIYRWLQNDHSFIAALNSRRQFVYFGQADRLRALAGEAIDVLQNALHSDDERIRTQAAKTLLKCCSLDNLGIPTGPITASQSEFDNLLNLL